MCRFLARTVDLVCVALAISAPTFAQATTRMSVGSNGAEGSGYSSAPAISSDGRYCAFESSSDFESGDTNGFIDIYVRDAENGATVLASVGTSGALANNDCLRPCISADGRYVAFDTLAYTLVSPDGNHSRDVFVHDTVTGTTTRISKNSSGTIGSDNSTSPAISADGRYVAFTSTSNNLVASDTNFADDVFIHDRQTGSTTRVSVSSSGAQGDAWSGTAALSDDGRFVAFESIATNIVAGDTNGVDDVFVRDRVTGVTTRVSVSTTGAQGDDYSYFPVVSADGRYVLFSSYATNLVAGDTNGRPDVFSHDRQTGKTKRLSTDSNGAQANGASERPSMTSDGRFAAFQSAATNLVPGDLNGTVDIFIRDLSTSNVWRVSINTSGTEGNGSCISSPLSRNGRRIAFQSSATNLVPGDTNGFPDVFMRDRGDPQPVVFCTAGTTSHGCVPSISSTGTPSASNGSGFTLSVNALEGQKQGVFFYGIDNTGFTPNAWGTSSSLLCIKHPTQRTGPQNSGGAPDACNGVLTLDWNTYITTHPGAVGTPFTSGQSVYVQAWFRDPPSPKSTMLTNALEFVVAP